MAIEKGDREPLRHGYKLRRKSVSKPRLNFDILYEIMKNSNLRGLLAIMQTCHALQHAGAKLLLDRHLPISGQRQLRSFCRFMLADTPRRFATLHRASLLVSDVVPSDRPTIALLTEVLRHAVALEWLQIGLQADVLNVHPELSQAVSALYSLRVLSFVGPSERAHADLISSINAPLAELNVVFHESQERQPSQDLIHLLEQFSRSLELLAVHNVSCEPAPTIQYPMTLSLEASLEDAEYDFSAWIRSFPNITDLSIISGYGNLSPNLMEQHRALNMAAQEKHSWARLRYLSGYIDDLFVAAPTCKVDHLRVVFADPTWTEEFALVLESTSPQKLSVEVELDEDNWTEEWLVELLNFALTLADVKLKFIVNPSAAMRTEAILNSLLGLSETLQVSNLDLTFELDVDFDAVDVQNLPQVFKILRELDVGAFVQKFADRAGALRDLKVFVPCNSESHWSIERPEDGCSMASHHLYQKTSKWSVTDEMISLLHDDDIEA
ncbi:hypothetical protein CERSUDRAFT_124517 [Gelatoporia subvermispora B]|uniref:F-box domain-containing protein n=1 Tax=Ceriporiopsis subvermispora (strain B) TaxID=914234 RepID=M2RC58_CERS8|nr:hypothetical protein CERSUDRAFT_124517 [Gelatoporia subvermispora B]